MLLDLYSGLLQGACSNRLHLYGARAGTGRNLWLAITKEGFPCLVIRASENDLRADIALRSIDVEFSRRCEIISDEAGALVAGTYTVVRLNDADPDTVRLFLRLLEESFCRDAGVLDNRQIGDKILEIAELFRRLDGSTGDLVGLWGELHIIANSSTVNSAVRSWCSHKEAKFDFVCPDFVLEVKTTLRPVRQHRFSIEQLRPAGDFNVFIASLQVIEVPSGQTVPQMIEAVIDQIKEGGVRAAFLHRCVAKGGRDLYRSTLCLQCFPGGKSLKLLRAADIPVPSVAAGEPISFVRFDVDLSAVPSVMRDIVDEVLTFPQ
ncbi:PD-(D/E)XK motif protein [Pelagibacterium nitratireducens]|uniref:PD-(D/E)XK motif protein n=1 Tax=Pelagibacterium nitratireducens TaxID=1046114 RepID=A0ABZ2I6L2_9HYPH